MMICFFDIKKGDNEYFMELRAKDAFIILYKIFHTVKFFALLMLVVQMS